MRKISGRFGVVARITALMGMMLAAAIAAPAQTRFSTLHSFNYLVDGWQPAAGLIQGIDGNLYGTVEYGGISEAGSVVKMTPAGVLTTIYTFCLETNWPDGSSPEAALVQAVDGTFYGTTYSGGANKYGTIFKITPGGKLTTLYSMCAQSGCLDGYSPVGSLVQGADGNLYGAPLGGGIYDDGTIFKISPTGTLTTLYSFCAQTNCADGDGLTAGLVQGSDGNFYGATSYGGTYGDGTIFKISPSGKLKTLHSFDSSDGGLPTAALVQGSDGSLYGTTYIGGTYGGGTVFKITSSGVLTTLYNFCSQTGCTDGANPWAGLIEATDGNFYGTTIEGGTSFYDGTAFKMTSIGALTTLHDFTGMDGVEPIAPLFQGTNGNFYGTTTLGGAFNSGTVFGQSTGVGRFVKTLPNTGKVGTLVIILGTTLKGATNVTFNGTAATFTVVSGTAIKTTVPTGATTGPVQVVTPSGTLTSNVNFQVLP